MRIVRTEDEIDALYGCALVPTMGALHEGHLALVRHAIGLDAPVAVSIFVNPTQFGPGEDFERYPRRTEDDLERAYGAGADFALVPEVETIYPTGEHATPLRAPSAPLPAVATEPGLEDAFRPGHFAGVCQVVTRLFDLTRPRFAVFGEKDYQQLLVIRAMVTQARDRWPDLRIEAHETVREGDGLAMSSRNELLDDEGRMRALGLSRALNAARDASDPLAAERGMLAVLLEHRLAIDYAVVRDAETLLPVDSFERPTRAVVAARVGRVRLIDNQGVGRSS